MTIQRKKRGVRVADGQQNCLRRVNSLSCKHDTVATKRTDCRCDSGCRTCDYHMIFTWGSLLANKPRLFPATWQGVACIVHGMVDQDEGLISGLFSPIDNGSGGWCYDFNHCHFSYVSNQKYLASDVLKCLCMHLLCPPPIHATESMWESRHSPENTLLWRQCSLGAHCLYHSLLYGEYKTRWEIRFLQSSSVVSRKLDSCCWRLPLQELQRRSDMLLFWWDDNCVSFVAYNESRWCRLVMICRNTKMHLQVH